MSKTFQKFGGKKTVVKEYNHWYLMLRKEQVTLGSLILLAKDNVTNFSELSSDTFKEYEKVIREIELNLKFLFQYSKINYCMFMMVDPDVHFHVFPRYEGDKEFDSFIFKDYGWPVMPEVSKLNLPSENTINLLRKTLIESFK